MKRYTYAFNLIRFPSHFRIFCLHHLCKFGVVVLVVETYCDTIAIIALFYTVHTWKISHDDVIKWKHFPRNLPCVRGIHRSPVNSPHKVQWRGALMFSLICIWVNNWVNNREAGDLRPHRAHYDVTVMDAAETPTNCQSDWETLKLMLCVILRITVTSQWAQWRLKSPASSSFAQPFVRGQIKENIKAPRHWPLLGECTYNRWIPLTKGQCCGNVSIWWRHHGQDVLYDIETASWMIWKGNINIFAFASIARLKRCICIMAIYVKKHKIYHFQRWDGVSRWNPSSWKTGTCLLAWSSSSSSSKLIFQQYTIKNHKIYIFIITCTHEWYSIIHCWR